MTCSSRKRPDHHENAVQREIAPLVGAPDLDVIGGDHVDNPRQFDSRYQAAKRQFLSGHLEFGEPGFECVGSGLAGASALSSGRQPQGYRVEPSVDEDRPGLQSQVVRSHREQLSAPFVAGTAQSDLLPLVHGGPGYVSQDGFPSPLQLDQVFDLLGFAPELGLHPTPEFSCEILEFLRLPSHLFRVLGVAGAASRKVAASYKEEGALGRRGDT